MPNVEFNTDALTTNTGAPIVSNEFSLRAGKRGMKGFVDRLIVPGARKFSLLIDLIPLLSQAWLMHVQGLCCWRTTTFSRS